MHDDVIQLKRLFLRFFYLCNIYVILQVNIKDARGSSPLHIACQHGHVHIVKTLIVHSANSGVRHEEKRKVAVTWHEVLCLVAWS